MKKLLYINIDGFSYSYYERLKKEGKSQIFDKLAGDGTFFQNLSSGLVSITNPMQSAILCGAYSNKTHNFYQHFDKKSLQIVKHKRTFDAENVADVFLKSNKTVCSLHQFMLEDNPCKEGVEGNTYIKSPLAHSNFKDRFKILKDIVQGKYVISGEKKMSFKEFPDFMAVYFDDIDSLGHNNDYGDVPKRHNFEDRQKDIIDCLVEFQQELDEFINICKSTGLYDDLIILIATDHGMTPFFGKSKLSDVLDLINKSGIKADSAFDFDDETQIIALPYTIELSLYFIKPMTSSQRERLISLLESKDYVDRVFVKEEMEKNYGLDERGPDMLISPTYGNHFYKKDCEENYFGASHDSFHETSQHIFGLVFGNVNHKGQIYTDKVNVIELLPSILKNYFNLTLKDSTVQPIEI